ncbi:MULTISPECIES: GreA/GreB family elongation factor [Candidatus Microthrix]|jgi:transcription elongation factor GreA|uniref:Transcription elongation factor GreA n=1 Tax=Candidatus Neomicrothrix parvicella RN1 TaxID=1229780 RepID=R4Z4I6_9ACTN|nr:MULTISPECIES: transcription elongation factor GreA [Microthrix]NLH66843.1 transcription elongation factor GreA [Candidatus Microthrix parvicella]MBK7018127.1 transcription elongation factor GreA [Candidatus Microthrix sp.]MBL0204837.1 transcription elongation factor GreA [Candidatus Microthrix sp.]MBP6134129.1 transcription elongation factor GreA [Candidatus Microthrix sp.]MBP6150341.1 transcription elongation factor GreA [Candidatus Microthrix sp.]
MASTHELSQAAHDRLSTELNDLTSRGRLEIAEKIEAARELGDLKENGDYHAAKDEQGKMEARIGQIAGILEDAVVVGSDGPSDVVRTGVSVSLRYEDDDEVDRYLYGSIEEQGGDLDVVSPTSPLGETLAGKRVGDTVSFTAPNGNEINVKIVAIDG